MDSNSNAGNSRTVRRFHKKAVELRQELGKGQFGKVYKATIRDSELPKYVAIKIILPFIQQESIDVQEFRSQAYSEMYKMSLLNHKNVVQLLGMVESEIPWFVVEYMKDGNLLEFLRKKPDLREKDKIKFCYQIASGMEYLHQNKVLHKDLAARNILMDGKAIKIADMGLCSFATEQIGGSYSINGKAFAFRQAARECIVEQIYTFETDVWAFGVLMYEIWSFGAIPYGKHSMESDVRILLVDGKNPLDICSPKCPSEILALMLGHIFIVNWKLRPNFSELKHFFYGLTKGKEVNMTVKTLQKGNNLLPSPTINEPESGQFPGGVIEPNETSSSSARHHRNHPDSTSPRLVERKKFGLLHEHDNASSSSIPDLAFNHSNNKLDPFSDLSSSLPKEDYISNIRPRSGSHGPEDLHRVKKHNRNLHSDKSDLSSSPDNSNEQGSWLFSNQVKSKSSVTSSNALDIPFIGNAKSSSSVSLYPEFIPGRFQKDKRTNSQDLL